MNRLRSTSSDSQANSRRRLIVERLEHRQLLSAADVFPTVDQIEMSVVLGNAESENCELASSGGLSPFSGHFASQGAYQFDFEPGNTSTAGAQPAELTSPIESALSSSMPAVRPEQTEGTGSGREFIDEDVPEGENPFDASAPPVVVDPVLGDNPGASGGDFVPAPTIRQTTLPFGIYLDTFQDADSASSESLDSTNQPNGGFIDLTSLQRSEFERFDSQRGLEFETSARDGLSQRVLSNEAEAIMADSTLLELGLVDPQELLEESIVEEIDLDVEPEVPGSQGMSVAEQVAFFEQFGGVIVHEDGEISTGEQTNDLHVASDVPQERSRDQYQMVDAIIGNAKAFDVMFDLPVVETIEATGSPELLEAALQHGDADSTTDAAAVLKPVSGESATATEASLTSASVVLLLANRDKKRKQRRLIEFDGVTNADGLTLHDA